MTLAPIEDVASAFERFARVEGSYMSPFYAALAAGVAEDLEVIEVARRTKPRQYVANMLFGAVRLLLDEGHDDSLLALYPDGPAPKSPPARTPRSGTFFLPTAIRSSRSCPHDPCSPTSCAGRRCCSSVSTP